MTQAEIADLFARAFETASLINLDSNRYRAIKENKEDEEYAKNVQTHPQINSDSMTAKDKPYADLTAKSVSFLARSQRRNPALHGRGTLSAWRALRRRNAARLSRAACTPGEAAHPAAVRPFRAVAGASGDKAKSGFSRSARRSRSTARYEDAALYEGFRPAPLSITVRQYDALMELVKISSTGKGISSPATRRVGRYMRRRREAPDK